MSTVAGFKMTMGRIWASPDYVFNMQVWSSNLATSETLLQTILLRINDFEDGSWQVTYHNGAQPADPGVIIEQVRWRHGHG